MLRVWSVSGVCSVMKSARASNVSRSAFSTPISIARSGVRNGSKAMTFILQPERAAGDDRTDIARADQPERLAGHLDAHEAVLFPLARLRRGVGLGQLPREREHQRDGVFGGGDRIAERGVHHDHAAWRGGGDIDIVDPDPGAADDLEVAPHARAISPVTLVDERIASPSYSPMIAASSSGVLPVISSTSDPALAEDARRRAGPSCRR